MHIPESELILNPDGSIYHLRLKPEQIAETIITVGDPDRVSDVSKYFDSIEVEAQCREFKTCTGWFKGKRISVVSTGIGTDNIDIVFNELDALVNIDLNTRKVKDELTTLTIIRVGTSGAIQSDIPVDSFLLSEKGIGFDNLLRFYDCKNILDEKFSKSLMSHTNWSSQKSSPYVVSADSDLIAMFDSEKILKGITVTNVGFYGPQGRKLRLHLDDAELSDRLVDFRYDNMRISNLEMETAGIYGMAKLLGHKALSLNAILANRANGQFCENPRETIDKLILFTLETLVK